MKTSYKLGSDEEFNNFSTILNNNMWTKIHSDPSMNLTVYRQESENNNINMFKLVCDMEGVEPETLYNVLHDHNYRKVWDKNMIDGIVIELLNSTNEIGYYSAKFPSPVTNRDFVNQRCWRVDKQKNLWSIINWSVQHKDYPEKQGFVRALSILSGYQMEKIDTGLRFTYMTQTDIKGWIPTWITNKLIGKFVPNTATTLYRVAKDYPEWKKLNHPEWMPWLN
jgi:hypothetical protein